MHDCIKRALFNLQNAIEFQEDEAIEETIRLMREDFKSSKAKMYHIDLKKCALFEHEYEVPVPDKEWKAVADHVVHCLKLFFDSRFFKQISNLHPDDGLEIEEYSSFTEEEWSTIENDSAKIEG